MFRQEHDVYRQISFYFFNEDVDVNVKTKTGQERVRHRMVKVARAHVHTKRSQIMIILTTTLTTTNNFCKTDPQILFSFGGLPYISVPRQGSRLGSHLELVRVSCEQYGRKENLNLLCKRLSSPSLDSNQHVR